MESLLDEEEVLSCQTGITAKKGHNVWSGHWIAHKVLLYFLEPVFHEVPMESLISEVEVLSRQTLTTTKKGHNFRFDCWIVLNVWQ